VLSLPKEVLKMVEAYCVKCKAKKEMKEGNEVTMKGKGGTERKAMKGKCPTCGTTMFKILGGAAKKK
jgi:Zn finger protein HypA/HybF involved in hydrogenase expression